jgi:hypothetical protein
MLRCREGRRDHLDARAGDEGEMLSFSAALSVLSDLAPLGYRSEMWSGLSEADGKRLWREFVAIEWYVAGFLYVWTP